MIRTLVGEIVEFARHILFPTAYGPPRKLSRAAWVVMISCHAAAIGTGLVGFALDPSPSVTRVIGGEIASTLWSGLFVLFGVLALLARAQRAVNAEVVAVSAIAAGCLLWAVMLTIASNPAPGAAPVAPLNPDQGALQTAGILLTFTLFQVGWVLSALDWLRHGTTESASDQIVAVAAELRRQADQSAATPVGGETQESG